MVRTKSLERIQTDGDRAEHRLKRTLTVWDLIGIGIGGIIGTGIFVLIGTATVGDAHRLGAGPGIILSFILSGVTCALAALCYAEFASMIPAAGSAYTYSYATMGEFLAWLTGWNLILEYGVACVVVAIGWSGYFNNILTTMGIVLPVWATHPPGTAEGAILNLPAAIIVLIVTAVLILGMKESARATSLIVMVKLAVVLFFLAVGAFSVNPANWTPFMPNGFAGVGTAAAIVFFAFIGFDAVSTTAEEAQNPQRDLPIGILVSLGICTVLYVLVAAVLTGMVPYTEIDIHAPIAEALRVGGFEWGSAVVATGALAGITSVLFVMMIGQIRVFFAMSRDRLLGPWLSAVHPKYGTPHHATLITGIGVAVMAALVPIGEAADMTNIGTLFAFVLVCLGLLILRRTRPNHPRPFRTPFMPYVPILGTAACLGLMAFLPLATWIRFGVWSAIGIVIYFGYGINRSRLEEPTASGART
jgi:APA family basic amino acid/polyamine antiporter